MRQVFHQRHRAMPLQWKKICQNHRRKHSRNRPLGNTPPKPKPNDQDKSGCDDPYRKPIQARIQIAWMDMRTYLKSGIASVEAARAWEYRRVEGIARVFTEKDGQSETRVLPGAGSLICRLAF